ncbi:MAG: cache domain-containing protein [Lachnospiraceae bacterium]|nr:cache domain-containing protein [Lachnospiraceae bacterium]
MKKTKENKGKTGMRSALIRNITGIAILPLIVMAVILTVVGIKSIREGMQDQKLDALKSMTIAIEGALDSIDSGEYSLEGDDLHKGSYNVTEHVAILDKLVDGTDTDVTLFFDKTRRATTLKDVNTGERIVGSDAGEEVYNRVVKEGKAMSATDLEINGKHYYAYYSPMKSSDGNVVGMFFAGAPVTDFNAYIAQREKILCISSIVVCVVSLILIILFVAPIKRGIVSANHAIQALAEGDLLTEIDPGALKRKDELGDMARETNLLKEKLVVILTKVHESSAALLKAGNELSDMASQTSQTADEISRAVEDISRGAVSQADEIDTVSSNIMSMGEEIAGIVNGVAELDQTSEEMEVSRSSTMTIVDNLAASNQKTLDAIAKIGEQIKTTNDSAGKINEAIQIITSIAEETNLLSLNASIEAARAGEQGKGFAVVANQIQKLAEQSNESSQKIAETIAQLMQDSNKTVDVMQEVEQIINEESNKLIQTKTEFENVSRGIERSRVETEGIKGRTTSCDSSRKNVVDTVTNLSAISEENAASTQQTTASMQELNATINLLAEEAGDLTKLSEALDQEVNFFQL